MMRSIHFPVGLCACVLFAFAGVACSAAVKPWPQRLAKWGYTVGPSVDGVPNYSVQSWRSLDDRHIMIETEASADYLITLAEDCTGLHAAETIGFSSTNGDLALSDDLIIHQVDANFKCPLQTINTLEPRGYGPGAKKG